MVSKMHQRVLDKAAIKAGTLTEDDIQLRDLIKKIDASGPAPDNDFWDKATDFYNLAKPATVQVSKDLADELTKFKDDPVRREKLKELGQEPLLASLVRQVTVDTQTYLERLDTVFETHKDKQGGTKDGEEHVAMLNVNSMYHDAADVFHQLVIPNVNEIHELIGVTERAVAAMAEQRQAELVSQEQAALAEAQDPAIVSDVVFKEA